LSENERETPSIQTFVDLMRDADASRSAIGSFRFHYQRLADGERGLLSERDIQSTGELANSEDFRDFAEAGRNATNSVAVIKLNGGLGTSMGLNRAKSLIQVRSGLSFLDLIVRQVLALRTEVGTDVPLLLMNSFRTEVDTLQALASHKRLEIDGLPLGFVQNRIPKILEHDLNPAHHDQRPELEWCPPGHGDLYSAIQSTGTLDLLIDRGIEYAFVSNADNLGAVFDWSLLGYMVTEGIDFMLEAADRTPADRKGGHLCRLPDGRLALRESGQCPPEEKDDFQDIERHRYFNTNNLWVHLPTLHRLLEDHHGFLPLPTLVNRKTLDPRDSQSPAVYQLETVMGTAISYFPNSAAVRVPRRRFSPVKNTNDLLGVRSDAFELSDDGQISLDAGRNEPPVIQLDERYFKLIDEFERRFPSGPPSLRLCDRLTVDGDVTFGEGVVIEGDSTVSAAGAAVVPEGTVIHGTLEL
jgi:UTP--glucose-1-phosphate uridylyltransferase